MDDLRSIIEALIFASERPLSLNELKEVCASFDPGSVKKAVEELAASYNEREAGIQILEVAGGFKFATNKKYADYIRNLFKKKHVERLSSPALETLAIITYKQPVTKLDIESLRGVNVDGVVKTLLEKGLIRISGRKEVVGRPLLFSTTREFLEYFGLKSLQDLPPIEEFVQMGTEAQNVKEELSAPVIEPDEGALVQSAEKEEQTEKDVGSVPGDNEQATDNKGQANE